MQPIRSFDELSVGQEFRFGTMRMPLDEVLDFARRWDPQPFHVDEARAKETLYGGLIASGIHTLAAAFGHMIRTGFVGQVCAAATVAPAVQVTSATRATARSRSDNLFLNMQTPESVSVAALADAVASGTSLALP